MEIKVKFEIGVTAQLAALLKGLVEKGEAVQGAEKPEANWLSMQKSRRLQKGLVEKGEAVQGVLPAEEPKVAKVEEPKAEKVEEPKADKPVEAKVETAAAPSAKKVTVQDVRAAMDRARTRIEGEGYKDLNPKHPLHNALTSEFKGIAALLGADKPSELPEEDRATFVKECDLLGEEEGKIVKFTLPF